MTNLIVSTDGGAYDMTLIPELTDPVLAYYSNMIKNFAYVSHSTDYFGPQVHYVSTSAVLDRN
jgi:hypothetical protein